MTADIDTGLDPGKEDRADHGLPVVPSFDGFRAMAILGVVAIHVLLSSGVSAREGDNLLGQLIWGTAGQAVVLLFIISGFVVFLPTAARGSFGDTGNYAVRRLARIAPAYWLILVVIGVLMAVDLPPGFAYPTAANVASHVAFVQAPGTLLGAFEGWPSGYGFNVDVALWTLSVEMAFYLVLPFIATAYLRRPLVGLGVCAAIAIGWRELFDHLNGVAGIFGGSFGPTTLLNAHFAAHDQLPFWAFSFGLGMTSAWAFVELRRRVDAERLRRIAGRLQLAAIAAVVLFVYLAGHYATTADPPFTATLANQTIYIGLGYSAACAAFMLSTALASGRRQRPFAALRMRRLGDISYGVYLSHSVILLYMALWFSPVNDGSAWALIVWCAIAFPLSLLYGYLSARYVEMPIRRWARSRGRHAETSRAAT